MVKEIRPAIILIVALTLITGLIYPMATTGLTYIFFTYQAKGSMVEKDGKVIGSELIGQLFTGDQYFHGRPSASVAPDPKDPSKTVEAPYNAANSGGSNLGPTSKALIERIKGDVVAKKGGKLEIRKGKKGEYGVCKFPNGKECEEWALFRGKCSPEDEKAPATASPDQK